jgi:HlyD family secretion protein
VDNGDLLLRPGMTATAEIVVQRLDDTLLVPNAALRFDPDARVATSTARKGSLLSQIMPRPPRPNRQKKAETADTGHSRVWVLNDGVPVPVEVSVGPTDGQWTAVSGEGIRAGTPLIVDLDRNGR